MDRFVPRDDRLFTVIASAARQSMRCRSPMTPSMLPRVGVAKKAHVFYNTGHGHLGWTLVAITAHPMAGHVMLRMQDNVHPFITPAIP